MLPTSAAELLGTSCSLVRRRCLIGALVLPSAVRSGICHNTINIRTIPLAGVYERVGIVRLEGGYRDLIVQTGPPRVYGNLWVYRRVWKALMACQRHDSKTAVRQSKPE